MTDCGKPQELLPRIVGGEEYSEHKHPWLVAIFDQYNAFICVGSLVSRSHVLTAAHCCDGWSRQTDAERSQRSFRRPVRVHDEIRCHHPRVEPLRRW
uniref:Tick serine protease n=1 Tax=Rhipicephalus zambeziensis TaxID=60191 RepID=A0A224YF25_9ACAR